MRRTINKKIDEIIQFAGENQNRISYYTVADVLKDREEQIDEKQLQEAMNLLNSRGIAVVQDGEDDESYPAEDAADSFIPADVNISQRNVNIYNLMERLENDEIELNPEFQRHKNLWNEETQSRLIESLMLKIPIPAFYFNAADESRWIVIDGLQRLTAFQNFLVGDRESGEKKKFVGLQYLRDFNGRTFDELPRQYVRRIKETSVIAFAVERGTPDAVVFNIFKRINTGGLQLNEQEIRQALYHGKSTKLVECLAESEEFLEATQHAISPARMNDREYVTRFLAFTEIDYRKDYKGNIDNYLIKAMKQINQYDESRLEEIDANFRQVMVRCSTLFGRLAFRKYRKNGRRGPINKALFEMWSVCLIELSQKEFQRVMEQKSALIERFGQLLEENEFLTELKAGDQYSTIRRIERVRQLLKEFI